MWSGVTQFVGSLFGIGKTVVDGWQERKSQKLKSELELAEAQTRAKIKRLETGQKADIAWENLSIEKSGWRGEWFTLLLSLPVVLCFVPGGDHYVYKGFASLEKTPEWFRWAFMVAVGSSFGYRKLCDFMSFKKGDK